jgi:hypothetical protein
MSRQIVGRGECKQVGSETFPSSVRFAGLRLKNRAFGDFSLGVTEGHRIGECDCAERVSRCLLSTLTGRSRRSGENCSRGPNRWGNIPTH